MKRIFRRSHTTGGDSRKITNNKALSTNDLSDAYNKDIPLTDDFTDDLSNKHSLDNTGSSNLSQSFCATESEKAILTAAMSNSFTGSPSGGPAAFRDLRHSRTKSLSTNIDNPLPVLPTLKSSSTDPKKDANYGHAYVLSLQNVTSEPNRMRTLSGREHPTELLLQAVKTGNENYIKDCLKDSRVNLTPSIIVAAERGNLDVLKILINYSSGIKTSARLNPHRPKTDSSEIKRVGSGIYGSKYPALSAAARHNRLEIVQYLIELKTHVVNPGVLEIAIKEAVCGNAEDVVKYLADFTKFYNLNALTCLCAENNNVPLLKFFYQKGADNVDQLVPIAVDHNYLDLTVFLLEELKGYPKLAYQHALEHGRGEILIYLHRRFKSSLDMDA